ncbi:TetR/AcrR family transcriptional regulator [Croceibacterium xixiisoli]|nr:TetR/AcrR family transcriptional regulator [Croceibacterium xixiisoli]
MTEQRRTGRPTLAEAEAIRDRVLDGALQQFSEKGSAASMDDIAAACGVSKLTIYRRFASKEALLIAVIDRSLEQNAARFTASAEDGRAPMDWLKAMARAKFDEANTMRGARMFRLVMEEIVSNPALGDRVEDWDRAINQPMAAAIRAAQASGEIIDGDADALANMLRDLLDGLAKRIRFLDVPPPDQAEADAFFDQRWAFFERAVQPR